MYTSQLITEAVKGKHNIRQWTQDEVDAIDAEDIALALERAELFLTQVFDDLEQKGRVEEIILMYGLEDAKQLIVDTLLSVVILIKPDILVRKGKKTLYPGVAPMQSIATQIGMALHQDRIDAVTTGIEILSHFQDLGIYQVFVVAEADRAVNANHIEVHGDSAVIRPTLDIPIELYLKIQMTSYLPPSLIAPKQLFR